MRSAVCSPWATITRDRNSPDRSLSKWLAGLRDVRASKRIVERIFRLSLGNAGDVKPAGEGISEIRIDYGPGYRVYYVQHGSRLSILLAGGDKRTQGKDIRTARQLAKEV